MIVHHDEMRWPVSSFLLVASCAPAPGATAVSIAPALSSTQAEPVVSALPRQTRPDSVRIDKTVTFDDSAWHIIEARDAGQVVKSNRADFDEDKRTIGRFVMVHYEVTNLEKKDEMMLDRPKLVDDRDREFSAIDMEDHYVPRNTKKAGLDLLPPGVPKEYWTVIEVPSDASHLKFTVHGFALLGKTEKVELGL